jgi:hypothetical protein
MDATTLIYAITLIPVAALFFRQFRRDGPPDDPGEDTTADS